MISVAVCGETFFVYVVVAFSSFFVFFSKICVPGVAGFRADVVHQRFGLHGHSSVLALQQV